MHTLIDSHAAPTLAQALARALAAKRDMWMHLETLEGLGRDPSHERDIAFDAWSDARDVWSNIIRTEWYARRSNRLLIDLASGRMSAAEAGRRHDAMRANSIKLETA